MPEEQSTTDKDGSKTVPVAVAVIGALAVLLSAALANWDKIFPGSHPAAAPTNAAAAGAASAPPNTTQATSGEQSPAISGVGRDVTINFGPGSADRHLADAQRAAIDGEWETAVFSTGGYEERLYLRFETFPDGRLLGAAQYVSTDGPERRIFSELGLVDGRTDGRTLSAGFFAGANARDAAGELTIPLKEEILGEVTGGELKLKVLLSDMAPVSTRATRLAPSSPLRVP